MLSRRKLSLFCKTAKLHGLLNQIFIQEATGIIMERCSNMLGRICYKKCRFSQLGRKIERKDSNANVDVFHRNFIYECHTGSFTSPDDPPRGPFNQGKCDWLH